MSEETIPQMRERIESLEKNAKASEKALAAAEAKARLFEARDAFREAGYKPDYAELFVKGYEGDITKEAAVEFAGKYGFAASGGTEAEGKTAEGATTEGTSQETQSKGNLAALSRAGSRAGEGGAAPVGNEPMTRDAYNELYKTDPAAARKAVQEGRVQIRKDNPYAQRQ